MKHIKRFIIVFEKFCDELKFQCDFISTLSQQCHNVQTQQQCIAIQVENICKLMAWILQNRKMHVYKCSWRWVYKMFLANDSILHSKIIDQIVGTKMRVCAHTLKQYNTKGRVKNVHFLRTFTYAQRSPCIGCSIFSNVIRINYPNP